MPAVQHIDIASAIFMWDYESANVKEYQIVPMIRNCLNECIGAHRVNERAFTIFCNIREISSATSRAINRIKNVDLVHVDSNHQSNATDEKIKQKLHQINMNVSRYDDDNKQSNVIVLISGNCEFGYFLSNMNRNGWRVLLLHPPLVSHDFIDCAEFHYDLSQFVSQIVDEQHRDKLIKITNCINSDQLGYLLVTNLLMNNRDDMPTERIICILHTATEDAHGRVIYFNQMAGEAVLTFYTVDNTSKGLTAAVLGKNVRLLLGGNTTATTTTSIVEVIAIKDPSSELMRMKFTVHQHIVDDVSLMNNSNTSSSGHWSKEKEIVQTAPSSTSSSTNDDRISPSSGVSSSNLSVPAAPAPAAAGAGAAAGAVINMTMPPAASNNNKRSVIVIENNNHKVDKTDDEYPPLPPASNSIGDAGLLRRYSDVVKQSQSSSASAVVVDSRQKHDRKRLGRVTSNSNNKCRTSLYFRKPAMQCFHWDNPEHLKHSDYECKFWHPRERCRFYPACKVAADACGYAHPFCDIYCECENDTKDMQKNHRINPIIYNNRINNYINSRLESVDENDDDNATEITK